MFPITTRTLTTTTTNTTTTRLLTRSSGKLQDWIPNYGVWLDEVEPFGMTHLMKKKWPRATVFLGGGDGEKKILPRPYGQVCQPKPWTISPNA